MSYNPTLQYAFVCSSDSAIALKSAKNPFAGYQGGKTFIGVTFGAFLNWGGTFTAMNMANNKKVWQKRFAPEPCYSGSLSTAGGLVFMGQGGASFEKGLGKNATTGGTGLIVAYNAQTGEQLFSREDGRGRERAADDVLRERQAVRRDLRRRQHLQRGEVARRPRLRVRAAVDREHKGTYGDGPRAGPSPYLSSLPRRRPAVAILDSSTVQPRTTRRFFACFAFGLSHPCSRSARS